MSDEHPHAAPPAPSPDAMDADLPEEEEAVFVDPRDETLAVLDDGDAAAAALDDMDLDADAASAAGSALPAPADASACVLSGHADAVYCVAVRRDRADPASLWVCSGGGDDRALLTRVRLGVGTARPDGSPAEVHAASDSVACASFAPTSDVLVTGAFDGSLRLTDAGAAFAAPPAVGILEGPPDAEFVAHHVTGDVVLVGSSDGTAWLFGASEKTAGCMQVFVGHEGPLSDGAFTPDGRQAVTAGTDGTVRVWAPRTGVCKGTFRDGPAGAPVHSLAVGGGAGKNLVLAGAADGSAWVVHLESGKKKSGGGAGRVVGNLVHSARTPAASEEEEESRGVEAVGFCSADVNPHWCATGGVDGVLKVWDLATLACRHSCVHEGAGGITRLRWHAHRPLVYTASSDAAVRLWDARSGACLRTLTGHADMINDLAILFPPAGEAGEDVVVTGSDDGTARIFLVGHD